jgi:hypothetical protein
MIVSLAAGVNLHDIYAGSENRYIIGQRGSGGFVCTRTHIMRPTKESTKNGAHQIGQMALERLPELLNVDVVEHALHRDLLLADGLDSARVDAGEPVREGLLLLGAVQQLRGLLVRVRKAALDVDRDDRNMVEDRCVRLE